MSRLLKICVFAVGLAAGFGVERAHADEGYLCEGGRIVYVKFGERETMKKTEPCIAAYYGLTVEPQAAALKAAAHAAPAATLASPVRTLTPTPKPTVQPHVDLRRLEESDEVKSRSEERKSPRAVRAADGTDYRNIPVINAAAGSTVFLHTK